MTSNLLVSLNLLTFYFVSAQRFVKITSCSASKEQPGFECAFAHDGVSKDTGKGWAMSGVLPSWAAFNLEREVFLDKVKILTGVKRNNHMMTSFVVEVDIDGVWTKLENMKVVEDPESVISDGRITLSKKLQEITLEFTLIGLTSSLRLTAHQADLGGRRNLVVTEVILESKIHNVDIIIQDTLKGHCAPYSGFSIQI